MKPAAVELFAGGGGAALGLRSAGFEGLLVERDGYPAATLRAAGFMVVEGDVGSADVFRKVVFWCTPVVSEGRAFVPSGRAATLLWASPPCQPFSTAGKRRGMADPRALVASVVDYVAAVRPKFAIIENVPGAPVGAWAELIGDYFGHVGWFELDAADFGVPVRRKRAFSYGGPVPLAKFLSELAEETTQPRSVEQVLPHLEGKWVRDQGVRSAPRATSGVCPTITTKGTLYVYDRDPGASTASFTLVCSAVGALAALAASQAAAMPTLSFSSTMMRSAVFFPMPFVFASAAASPRTTQALKFATVVPLSTSSAVFGPMPLTCVTSRRNKSRSDSVANP